MVEVWTGKSEFLKCGIRLHLSVKLLKTMRIFKIMRQMPRYHQSLKMSKSCLVKHGFNKLSSHQLLDRVVIWMGDHLDKIPCSVHLGKSGWYSKHQSRLSPLLQMLYVDWVSVDLNLTSRVPSRHSSFLPPQKSIPSYIRAPFKLAQLNWTFLYKYWKY